MNTKHHDAVESGARFDAGGQFVQKRWSIKKVGDDQDLYDNPDKSAEGPLVAVRAEHGTDAALLVVVVAPQLVSPGRSQKSLQDTSGPAPARDKAFTCMGTFFQLILPRPLGCRARYIEKEHSVKKLMAR